MPALAAGAGYGNKGLIVEQESAAPSPPIERVEFAGRRGNRLVGLWHHGGGKRAVILCHGMESSKEGTKSVRLAHALAAAGCAALRFDFSYAGESDGEFADLTVSGEVEDLAGAWRFAAARTEGPIGVIGSSLGGTVALLFAAEEPSVAALATIAAVAYTGRFARALSAEQRETWRRDGIYEWQGMRLRPHFLDDVERLDVPCAVKRIRCPLLVTHGTADTVVPSEDAEAIAAGASAAVTLRLYDGADHRFSDPVLLDQLLRDLVSWILTTLEMAERRAE